MSSNRFLTIPTEYTTTTTFKDIAKPINLNDYIETTLNDKIFNLFNVNLSNFLLNQNVLFHSTILELYYYIVDLINKYNNELKFNNELTNKDIKEIDNKLKLLYFIFIRVNYCRMIRNGQNITVKASDLYEGLIIYKQYISQNKHINLNNLI